MIKSKIYNYSKDELQDLFNQSCSISDVLRKIDIKGSSSIVTMKRIIEEYNINTTLMYKNGIKMKKDVAKRNGGGRPKDVSCYLKRNGIKVNGTRLREKLLSSKLKENKCEICGLSYWNGQAIKLEIHHKDGDHNNNELDNLQLLCPNCHSYTDNYGAYNSKNIIVYLLNRSHVVKIVSSILTSSTVKNQKRKAGE